MPCFESVFFFINIALKLSYFCKKLQEFRALGALAPDPQNNPPIRISGYAPALISSVLCANPTHKYPNWLFKYYLHLQQHTSARAAFQLLFISKTKARNQKKVKNDIRLALLSSKPRIPKLALWLHSLTSH